MRLRGQIESWKIWDLVIEIIFYLKIILKFSLESALSNSEDMAANINQEAAKLI